jgi:hypothetical protein
MAARAFCIAASSSTTSLGGRGASGGNRAAAIATAEVTSASSRSASLRTAAFWLAASLAAACARSRLSSEAIVALRHGVFGALEGFDGGAVILGGVRVGAGRARGVDGALGLMQLLARRLAARCREQGRDDEEARGGGAWHRA